MALTGITFVDTKVLNSDYIFYWVFSCHKNIEGKGLMAIHQNMLMVKLGKVSSSSFMEICQYRKKRDTR